jgi:hypothetical protein
VIELHEPYEIIIRNAKYYDGPGVYVGRPSVLGNPFKIGKDGTTTREDAIRRYDEWFNNQLQSSVQIEEAVIQCLSTLYKTKKLTLICWCYPKSCHADIIKNKLLEILNE